MKIFTINQNIDENLENLTNENFVKFISSSSQNNDKQDKIIKKLILDVQKNGDKALIKTCNKFDDAKFKTPDDLIFSEEEIKNSAKLVSKPVAAALKTAFSRIKKYHQKQMPKDLASAICKLIDDPSERHRIGNAARERIKTIFNWEAKGAFMEKLFKDLDTTRQLKA